MEKIKVNDWVYYEFTLCQVVDIHEGRLTLTDGFVQMSNIPPNECWPQTIDIKLIAEECRSLYKNIQDQAGNININYPDIHQNVATYFHNLCDFRDKPELQKITWTNLRTFVNEVCESIQIIRKIQVSGIPILRP